MRYLQSNLLQSGLHLNLVLKLSDHGLPTAAEVSLEDEAKPSGVLRVDHFTLEIPEKEVANPLVTQSSLEKEARQQTVMMRLKLQSLQNNQSHYVQYYEDTPLIIVAMKL